MQEQQQPTAQKFGRNCFEDLE